jgi:hypothetical protein
MTEYIRRTTRSIAYGLPYQALRRPFTWEFTMSTRSLFVSAALLANLTVATPAVIRLSYIWADPHISPATAAIQKLARRRSENAAQPGLAASCGDSREPDDRDRDNGVSRAREQAAERRDPEAGLTDC